jgi:hypothetical protein
MMDFWEQSATHSQTLRKICKDEELMECDTDQSASCLPTFRKINEDDGLLGAVRRTFADVSEDL